MHDGWPGFLKPPQTTEWTLFEKSGERKGSWYLLSFTNKQANRCSQSHWAWFCLDILASMAVVHLRVFLLFEIMSRERARKGPREDF